MVFRVKTHPRKLLLVLRLRAFNAALARQNGQTRRGASAVVDGTYATVDATATSDAKSAVTIGGKTCNAANPP